MSATTSPNVDGWASTGQSFGDDAPSVIVSQEASPGALMSWAFGQLQQLNVLLKIIGTATHDQVECDPAELVGSIRHQLEQVQCVMLAAIDRLPSGRPTDNQVPS